MKKVLSLILFTPLFTTAQINFELVLPLPPLPTISAEFDGYEHGSTAVGDVDNDGDLDILFTGFNGMDECAHLYLNDGIGNYSKDTGTIFEGVVDSDAQFADIDGDTDLDILLIGKNSANQRISRLYLNDGTGTYVQAPTAIDALDNCDIAFYNVDGDLDVDVMVSGDNGTNRISKLYMNDGSGNFTLSVGTPFEGVEYGDLTFADVESDGDPDLLLTGLNNSNNRITRLYLNDGAGNFSLNATTSFADVYYSAHAFEDIDGDNDLDVIINGRDITGWHNTTMYLNDGSGNFTPIAGPPFINVKNGDIDFADIDGDSDMDLLYTGYDDFNSDITLLYENDGMGTFTEVTNTPFVNCSTNGLKFFDVDGDSDMDVVIAGRIDGNERAAYLYVNDGTGNFQKVTEVIFNGVTYGQAEFADFNGDGTEDIIIVGERHGSSFDPSARMYTNDGSGVYTYVSTPSILPIKWGSLAVADVDGDLDMDIVVAGQTIINLPTTKLYLNDGFGNFTEDLTVPFDSVYWSDIEFGDIDGDLDQDLIITGRDPDYNRHVSMYTNDGAGNFTKVAVVPFFPVYWSSIEFGDIDGDSDEDVLIIGNSASGPSTKLFENDGTGNFTEVSGTPFPDLAAGEIDFADVDGNNSLDLLITGSGSGFARYSKLFLNDGTGTFTESSSIFHNVWRSGVDFSDVDLDGDQDVLINGEDDLNDHTAILYENDGNGNFTPVSGMPFVGTKRGFVIFGNANGDLKEDVLILGHVNPTPPSYLPTAKLYMNNSCLVSTAVDSQNVCGTFTWIDGNTYNSDTVTTYTLIGGSTSGCDSIVTLNLTSSNSFGIDSITSCDSLTWLDGNTYYSNNNSATYILQNALGCDSIVQLDLTVHNSNSVIDLISACVEYTWIDSNTYTTSNNTAAFVLTNSLGCDSVIQLNLTISYPDTTSDSVSSCDSYTWIDGNTYVNSTNTPTHILTNSFGCDSVITLELTIPTVDVTVTVNSPMLTANSTGGSYQWVDCDSSFNLINGETGQSYAPNSNGNYAVIVSEFECTDTSDCYLIADLSSELTDLQVIKVWPNPTTGSVIIKKEFEDDISVRIVDVTGREISTIFLSEPLTTVDLSEHASGIYYLLFLLNDKNEVYRLVKE